MDNNVLVSIKTRQFADGEELDAIELQTPGKFGILNGKYYIKYEESEMTGFPDTTTTIKVWENNVLVGRKGKFNMQLHYEAGTEKLCLYPTPYGEIGTLIKTDEIEFDFVDLNGKLRVDYELEPNNESILKNSLNVSIKPLGVQKG